MASHALSVRYRLTLSAPETHLVDVEMRILGAGSLDDRVALSMAAWSPGSYKIRDYARHVQQLIATDGAGAVRPAVKTSKATWRIDRGDSDEIKVRYQVYGYELSVRSNHIDDTHAFLHGPATFITIDGRRSVPCLVEVVAPTGRGWHIATGLRPASGNADLDPDAVGGAVFETADFDELLDCPIHVGHAEIRGFDAASAPAELVIWGHPDPGGVADTSRLVADLAAIMEIHAARFGHVPYERYTFILMLSMEGAGGLEHRNSSANLYTPLAFSTRKRYDGLLELLSHEYFHVWNGKRMYPRAHHQVDYSREAYTRSLWVVEGLSAYYDRHALVAANRMPAKRYLARVAEDWGQLQLSPGRMIHSLEDASFDAWIKLYQPDASNINTTVSYYLKGALVALVLDLHIRAGTDGERDLDDVLALLWSECGETGAPYPENLQPLFERATGLDLSAFFDRHVRGRHDPDLVSALGYAGLRLSAQVDPEQAGERRAPVWLGATLDSRRLAVSSVIESGPAQLAGVSPGDEIIAVDGYRVVDEASLRERLASRSPGDDVELAMFRCGRLIARRVALAKAPPLHLAVEAVDDPTDKQKSFYFKWLNESWPEPGTVAAVEIGRFL